MSKLSLVDDTFLRLESRRQPLHIAMLMLFEPPADASPDFAAQLAERLGKSVRAAPPFNQRLARRRGQHHWEEDDDFDLAHHFVHTSLPQPGRIRELLALHQLPDKPLIAGVPISIRRDDTTMSGNEVAFTIAHLATHIDDPLERLQAIKRCMDKNKQRLREFSPAQVMAYAAMMLMPGALNMLLGRARANTLGSVVISHVPGPREDIYWQGARMTGLYPASLLFDSLALNITVISRHDYVDFGLIACRKTVPQMQRLLDYLEDELAALEAATGTAAAAPVAVSAVKKRASSRARKIAKGGRS